MISNLLSAVTIVVALIINNVTHFHLLAMAMLSVVIVWNAWLLITRRR